VFNKHDLSTSVSFPKFDQVTWFVGIAPGSFDPLCGRVGAMTFGSRSDAKALCSKLAAETPELSVPSNAPTWLGACWQGATQNKQIKIKTNKTHTHKTLSGHTVVAGRMTGSVEEAIV